MYRAHCLGVQACGTSSECARILATSVVPSCANIPMQTVEDVISRMPNAEVFSVPDPNHGFFGRLN